MDIAVPLFMPEALHEAPPQHAAAATSSIKVVTCVQDYYALCGGNANLPTFNLNGSQLLRDDNHNDCVTTIV